MAQVADRSGVQDLRRPIRAAVRSAALRLLHGERESSRQAASLCQERRHGSKGDPIVWRNSI